MGVGQWKTTHIKPIYICFHHSHPQTSPPIVMGRGGGMEKIHLKIIEMSFPLHPLPLMGWGLEGANEKKSYYLLLSSSHEGGNKGVGKTHQKIIPPFPPSIRFGEWRGKWEKPPLSPLPTLIGGNLPPLPTHYRGGEWRKFISISLVPTIMGGQHLPLSPPLSGRGEMGKSSLNFPHPPATPSKWENSLIFNH